MPVKGILNGESRGSQKHQLLNNLKLKNKKDLLTNLGAHTIINQHLNDKSGLPNNWKSKTENDKKLQNIREKGKHQEANIIQYLRPWNQFIRIKSHKKLTYICAKNWSDI